MLLWELALDTACFSLLPELTALLVLFSGETLHFKSSLAFLLLGRAVVLSAEKLKP